MFLNYTWCVLKLGTCFFVICDASQALIVGLACISESLTKVTRLLKRQYIYDVAQRLLHWWLAVVTILLIITGFIGSKQEADTARAFTWSMHIQCGKLLLIGLSGRLVWGIIGPTHARFTALFHPKAWIWSLNSRKMLSADRDFGHHEQASMSYLGFYGLIVLMCVTGLFLAAIIHGEGPLAERFLDDFSNLRLFRKVHEYTWWFIAFFIVTHVGALIFHEWHDKIPLAQSMISGFQYRTERKVGRSDEEK